MTDNEIEWSNAELCELRKVACEWQSDLHECTRQFTRHVAMLRTWPHTTENVMIILGDCMALREKMEYDQPKEIRDVIRQVYCSAIYELIDIARTGKYLADSSDRCAKAIMILLEMEMTDEDYIPYNKDEDENND